MKYKVIMKISYFTVEFLFEDRMEALDFMETAYSRHNAGEDKMSLSLMMIKEEVQF